MQTAWHSRGRPFFGSVTEPTFFGSVPELTFFWVCSGVDLFWGLSRSWPILGSVPELPFFGSVPELTFIVVCDTSDFFGVCAESDLFGVRAKKRFKLGGGRGYNWMLWRGSVYNRSWIRLKELRLTKPAQMAQRIRGPGANPNGLKNQDSRSGPKWLRSATLDAMDTLRNHVNMFSTSVTQYI